MIPDGGTAVNALMTRKIDWIEIPLPDLMPSCASHPASRRCFLQDGVVRSEPTWS